MLVVYIVWGSTYLAIRIAVREGTGFPPFVMASMRVLVAAFILLTWARLAHHTLRLKQREISILAISATLLWVGGNGVVGWAEQYVDSGYAALLVASMPIWVAMMESIIDRRKPSVRLVGALLVGLAGVGVLNGPVIRDGSLTHILPACALILAAVSWGLGSLIQSRNPVRVAPEVSSGYQQLFGCVGLLIASQLLFREPAPNPIPEAWGAWAYLTLFGSVVAFTSFVKALKMLPTNIVMTYAYVNPLIAVFLGWLILGEDITLWTAGGSTLVILGVAGIFHEKRRSRTA